MKQTTYFGIFIAVFMAMVHAVPTIADLDIDGSLLLSVIVAAACLTVMNVCFFKGKLWRVDR